MRPIAAHRLPTPVVLAVLLLPLLGAKPVSAPVVQRVPSVEEVVEKEGFTPTASQSEIYRPGAVLVPNAKGGHDVIVKDCIGVEAEVSVMSQSSIATSLATGVSARLGVARGTATAGIEKRLSFVDPEQRTIPLSQISATEACAKGVASAGRLVDLSKAFVVYDVLVAQITNSVCAKADASGKVVALGEAEAAAYSECIQESNAQVPLGYKAVPLAQLVAVGGAPVLAPGGGGATQAGAPSGSGAFGGAGDLAKQLEAAEKLKAELEAKLAACLKAEAEKVRAQAKTDWADLAPLAAKTDAAAKAAGIGYFEKFVSLYGAAKVSCKNELGERSEVVAVAEVAQARAWLSKPAETQGQADYAMRRVPAGAYYVGCTYVQAEECDVDEKPGHEVSLTRDILVGETEVTQALYQRITGDNPARFSDCGATCPVENVSWLDAVEFANKLSASEDLERCYVISGERVNWPKGLGCAGYRLPTEAEWEVAARGGRDDKYAGGNMLGAIGWYTDNSDRRTHPVRKKQPNEFGLFDMSGNVAEWVWDFYADRAYTAAASTDPLGPRSGGLRVDRGGSWSSVPKSVRSSRRDRSAPDFRDDVLGFRLVRTAP